MSAFLTPVLAIRSRLLANYTDLPIVFDNDDAEDKDLNDGFLYCSPAIRDSKFATVNNSNPKTRTVGTIDIMIFTALNEGSGLGLAIADELATIFRGQSFGGVVCYNATVLDQAQRAYRTGEFWATMWTCPFYYDEHIPIGG